MEQSKKCVSESEVSQTDEIWSLSEEASKMGYCGKYWYNKLKKCLSEAQSREVLSAIAYLGPKEGTKVLKKIDCDKKSFKALKKEWAAFTKDGIGFNQEE